jgi:hypothetical protein
MDKLEEELGELGVDMKKRKMTKLREESEKPQRGKSIKRVGRTPSLPAKTATPKDQMIPDMEVTRFEFISNVNLPFFSCAKRSRKLDARLSGRGRRKLAREKQIAVFLPADPSTCSLASAALAKRSADKEEGWTVMFWIFSDI